MDMIYNGTQDEKNKISFMMCDVRGGQGRTTGIEVRGVLVRIDGGAFDAQVLRDRRLEGGPLPR